MSLLWQVVVAGRLIAVLGVCACFSSSASAVVSFTGDTQFNSPFSIGNTGFGTFRIDGGSTYTSTSNSTVIGYQSNAIGIATVTGSGSQWLFGNSNGIDVGVSGYGRLEILDGAVVNVGTSCCSGGGVDIGTNNGGQGVVVVDGASALVTNGSISVGSARLQITNNAMVSASQIIVGSAGRVELNKGTLRAGQLSGNNGVIVGTGDVIASSSSSFTNYGRLEATGGPLRFTGASSSTLQNNGVIAAEGSAIDFNGSIHNVTTGGNAAEITLRNGVVRAGMLASGWQLTNSAVLAAIGGTNDFYGRVTNTATGNIAVTNHSVLIFHDDVMAEGGSITVFPGSSAVFLEDLTMNEGSHLLANLAGTNQNTGFGDVEVVGVAQLAGNVQATLAVGYTPQAGDQFPIVAASFITGSLALGDMPALSAGLKWDLDREANRVVLSVVPGLAGDYNSNGVVDSADYVVWRKTVDQTGNNLAADGDSNGVVNAADYDFWRSRLGNSAAASALSAANVPEPGIALAFLAVFGLVVGARGGKLR